jgi:hypothetical protein
MMYEVCHSANVSDELYMTMLGPKRKYPFGIFGNGGAAICAGTVDVPAL